MDKIKPYITIIIIILMPLCVSQASENTDQDLPFYPGEKMVFHISWSFVHAGEAVLELLPAENFNGIDAYHFVYTAKTSPFVDLFYKLRDRVESYTNKEMTRSLLYKKEHQGKSKKEITVDFDWDNLEAVYYSSGKKEQSVRIMPGTFDPLSVFYAFRLFDPHLQSEISISISDGKKCVMGLASVIKREKIRIMGTSYDCFLVEPSLEKVGGVFQKSKDAKLQIWVTADEKRIPLRIKSKVRVGSFTADLVSYSPGVNK